MTTEFGTEIIHDFRNRDGDKLLDFEPEAYPKRLTPVTHGDVYLIALYELRRVRASDIPGINAGDLVLTHRCLPAVEDLTQCEPFSP